MPQINNCESDGKRRCADEPRPTRIHDPITWTVISGVPGPEKIPHLAAYPATMLEPPGAQYDHSAAQQSLAIDLTVPYQARICRLRALEHLPELVARDNCIFRPEDASRISRRSSNLPARR